MTSPYVYVVATVVGIILGASVLLIPHFDRNEPPRVYPRIPFVGHLIGLYKHGFKYYRTVGETTDAPMFMLPILKGGLVIARSKDTVTQVSRNSKTLTFDIFGVPFIKMLTNSTPRACEIMLRTDGPDAFVNAVHKMHATKLSPGPGLTSVVETYCRRLSERLQAESARISSMGSDTVELFQWARGLINGSTLRTFYGDEAPFDNVQDFENDWYAVEEGMDMLLFTSTFYPQVFARKTYLARERIISEFTKYYNSTIPDNAVLGKDRQAVSRRAGLRADEIGRMEVGALIGFIGNTAPSLFYLLTHIYHHNGLLDEIRAELSSSLQTVAPGYQSGDPIPFSFLDGLRTNCTLYRSTYDEILRLHQQGSSVRSATEDTWIRMKAESDEKAYLIKKDTVVIMPNAVLHRDEAAFPDPDKFNPRRFMNSKPAEHRPWGGGVTICPGRHFATAETLATCCMVLLGFDIECVDDRGASVPWSIPVDYQRNLTAGMFQPSKEFYVRVSRREEQSLEVDTGA